VERPVPPDLGRVEPPPKGRKGGGARKRLAPYGLLAPAGLWQILFFIVPMLAMVTLSLSSGVSTRTGFTFDWAFSNYPDVIGRYGQFFFRSFRNATIVTIIALLIAYPAAYWIAFYGGKRKATYLLLLLLPFFVSFVIRTLSWSFIFSDEGFVLGTLKSWGLMPDNFHILNTTTAIIAGITYNLLPFTTLPLFVSLDRIDKRLVEAASDLYASKREAFRKVVLPLSLPGIFAAVLLTFIPAVGDYVNAEILGGPGTLMLGNQIQTEFLRYRNYPRASALAFILMLLMMVGAAIYARVLGTEEITT
jgi:spermidine/putrescine transport system permease protein